MKNGYIVLICVAMLLAGCALPDVTGTRLTKWSQGMSYEQLVAAQSTVKDVASPYLLDGRHFDCYRCDGRPTRTYTNKLGNKVAVYLYWSTVHFSGRHDFYECYMAEQHFELVNGLVSRARWAVVDVWGNGGVCKDKKPYLMGSEIWDQKGCDAAPLSDNATFEQISKLAQAGNAVAQVQLANRYANGGQGVAKDYAQAVSWYRQAAEQGNSVAQSNLGLMYQYGRGGAKDYGQAALWYRKAADQGNADAQCYLGTVYEEGGHGLAQDLAQAKSWYGKAADLNDNPVTRQQAEQGLQRLK